MGIKNLIFGDPETQGMTYRIRVFDQGHHIKTATFPARGQDGVNLTVKPKDYYFLGEEVKLRFMINPKIQPRYFGNVMEIDFDVRDSCQLADIFDLCPDLVHNLNSSFYEMMTKLQQKDDNVLEAEFTEKTETEGKEKEKTDDPLDALTDPIPKTPIPREKELSDLEKKIQRIPGVKTTTKIIDGIANTGHTIKTNVQGFNILYEINTQDRGSDKQALIKKALDFCELPGNQKCLRWLPQYLHIEPEVSAICSQTELDGVGIMPMYYIKQSSAEIAEKMLSRPKVAEDWKIMLVYAAIAIGILMLVIFFILKLAGKL